MGPEQKRTATGRSLGWRLILLTDLGMIVKDSVDGSHDVFVESVRTGQPAAGVEVEVLGRNGLAIVSNQTDRNGHVAFPSLGEFKREKVPTAYVVQKGSSTRLWSEHHAQASPFSGARSRAIS
jgi:alpha-2-macroglobulin